MKRDLITAIVFLTACIPAAILDYTLSRNTDLSDAAIIAITIGLGATSAVCLTRFADRFFGSR